MELKLKIYEKKDGKKIVAKTYTADTYDIMFGTVEDLINLIDLDKLQTGSDVELIKVVGNIVMNGMAIIKPLLKDMFEGLSDEELRNTKTSEVAAILITVVKFTMSEIGGSATGKN